MMPDATCVDTLCKTYVPITACKAGAAAAKAEKKTSTHYYHISTNSSPLRWRPLAPLGDDVLKFVRELGCRRRLRSVTSESREKFNGPAWQFSEATQPAWWVLFPQTPSPNPKIHSINNILKLSPFVTGWRLKQKCVFDVGTHFT